MSQINIISSNNLKPPCVAHLLSKEQRKQIAISALEKAKKISHIALEHRTSRKFIYEQKEKALESIAHAFEKKSKHDEDVLFYLPVTYSWIKQLIAYQRLAWSYQRFYPCRCNLR